MRQLAAHRAGRAALLAPLAAGFGLAVWWAGRTIPPGAGYGSVSHVTAAVLGADGFLPATLAFAVLSAGAWLVLCALPARSGGPPVATLLVAAAPLLWGAALPALALALDAVSFWPSAPPLAALGLGVGGLLALHRMRSLARVERSGVASPVAHASASGARLGDRGGDISTAVRGSHRTDAWRIVITAAALVLPLVLLLTGWTAPSGDEPHYLTTAHSLAVDGDLDLADEYRERVYAPFHPAALSPHYRLGLRDGSRYSMHGIGLPLLIAPAYALARVLWPDDPAAMVLLPRAVLVLLYGAFAWVLYGFVAEIAGARAAARGTAAATLLAPLLFAPLFLFAETPAMLLSLLAFRDLVRPHSKGLWPGIALAVLPFVGVKYIPLAAAVLLAGILAAAPGRRLARTATAGAPFALGLLTHALFTWQLYGSPSPAAIYLGASGQAGAPALGGDWGAYLAAWPAALATAVGYLLDQKEGLLAYGPHFVLASAGLAPLAGRRRGVLAGLVLVAAAYVGPYALSQQLGGQGPPVRPLLAVLWTAAPALGVALALESRCRAYAALRGGLLALSAALTVALATQPALLPHDYPVIASRLLQRYAPWGAGWWRLFPQWVNVDEPNRLVTALWTVAIAALALGLWRHGRRHAAFGGADGSDAQIDATAQRDGGAARDGATATSGAPRDGRAGAWTAGWIAALVVVVAACGFVLLHHVFVLRTDLHRPTAIDDDLVAWVPEELPARAFAEPGGVWAVPGAPVDFLLISAAPLQALELRLRSLVPAEVMVALQGDVAAGHAAPGAVYAVRLQPGPGARSGEQYAYHARLRASAGAAPADLLGGEDERYLGVFLEITGRR